MHELQGHGGGIGQGWGVLATSARHGHTQLGPDARPTRKNRMAHGGHQARRRRRPARQGQMLDQCLFDAGEDIVSHGDSLNVSTVIDINKCQYIS
jgi:hypothetical protein